MVDIALQSLQTILHSLQTILHSLYLFKLRFEIHRFIDLWPEELGFDDGVSLVPGLLLGVVLRRHRSVAR